MPRTDRHAAKANRSPADAAAAHGLTRSARRLLESLAPDGAHARRQGETIELLTLGKHGVKLSRGKVAVADADGLVARGAAEWSRAEPQELRITPAGRSLLKRLAAEPDEAFLDQHREIGRVTIGEVEARHLATLNLRESPLLWLHRRGALDDAQFAAGERLRADFTLAGLDPRITTDWSRLGAGSGGSGGLSASEAMLAARQRFDAALTAVGPEFAGPLTDLCCFLKGIEQLERERGWPARAGKLVLRLALSALARHYGLASVAIGSGRGPRVWREKDHAAATAAAS